LKKLSEVTGIPNIDEYLIDQLQSVDLRTYATSTLNTLSGLVGNAALVLVYVIFFLLEESFLPQKIKSLMNNSSKKATIEDILNGITSSVNTYFGVKVVVSIITGLLSYFVLIAVGVDFAVLWAFLIFIFNFIPYIGSLVATLLPAFFSVFQFADYVPAIWIIIGVYAIQILVGTFVEPRIMGKSLNLSPIVVIFSLSFWGAIWGVTGMILSVPIVSVLTIVLAHFPETKSIAILFSEKGYVTTIDSRESK
jgi:predicted PurR-regulated permease PerM